VAERLRVAIDARRYQDEPLGGVGRALDGIVDHLAAEADVVLLTDARRRPAPSSLPQVALPVPRKAPETVWLQWGVARWLRSFDGIFHGTFNALPFRLPVPAVATIHDLSFEVHPEGFGRAKRRMFQVQARHAARVARQITVPSTHARDELVEHYRVPAERIVVTPWGVEARFGPEVASSAHLLLKRLGVTGPYVVAMGGARRRGLEVALEGFRIVRRERPEVVLLVVGSEAPPAEPGVVHAGRVDDEEWAGLLAGAEAFCYPTRYEGFGVPALEAIASGTPVVCGRVASLPEVLHDAAEWCEPLTPTTIATGLHRVLGDAVHAADLSARGLRRAMEHPTYEDTAERTLRAYHAAAKG
jgi:alpha-1,3-rhamnosyl/mannosyltransferase